MGKTWAIVMVRQQTKDRSKATGKQLRFFLAEEIYKNYCYSAYVTNFKLVSVEVWRLYKGRVVAENIIKV